MLGVAALLLSSFMGPQAIPPADKVSRSDAEKKISSSLLYEIHRARGQANPNPVPPGKTVVQIDPKQRALVDVRAAVTEDLTRQLDQLGSTVVSISAEADSIIAWVPLLNLERLAERASVRAIEPAAQAIHSGQK